MVPPGVGKTLSAGRYSRWDIVRQVDPWRGIRSVSIDALTGLNTILFTPPIINTPRQIDIDIERLRDRLKRLAFEPLRREEDQQLRRINKRDEEAEAEAFVTHDWLSSPIPKCKPTYAEVAETLFGIESINPRLDTADDMLDCFDAGQTPLAPPAT